MVAIPPLFHVLFGQLLGAQGAQSQRQSSRLCGCQCCGWTMLIVRAMQQFLEQCLKTSRVKSQRTSETPKTFPVSMCPMAHPFFEI